MLALVNEVSDYPIWGLPRLGMARRELLAVLARAREAGYALRASQYRGETPRTDSLNAIARPLFRGEAAVGALALLWPRGFMPPARFAEVHLARLKEAAGAIGGNLLSTAESEASGLSGSL